jgi:hypothetical protein
MKKRIDFRKHSPKTQPFSRSRFVNPMEENTLPPPVVIFERLTELSENVQKKLQLIAISVRVYLMST